MTPGHSLCPLPGLGHLFISRANFQSVNWELRRLEAGFLLAQPQNGVKALVISEPSCLLHGIPPIHERGDKRILLCETGLLWVGERWGLEEAGPGEESLQREKDRVTRGLGSHSLPALSTNGFREKE